MIDDRGIFVTDFRRQFWSTERVTMGFHRLRHMAPHRGLRHVGLVSTVKITAASLVCAMPEMPTTSGVLTPGPLGWVTVMVAVPLASDVPRYSVTVVVNSVLSSTTGAVLFTAP